MGDLIRVRLTGLFRDEDPDTYDKDPGCEAQFEDLDDPTVLKTVRVTFANNAPCPWYAAMAHFYGTVRCATGTMTVPGIGTYRTYEVNAQDRQAIVTALAIRSADGTGLVCLELPADATFHAVVLGRTQPQFDDEALPTASQAMTYGNWGSLPVPAGAWCRLMFMAPDGSNYGTAMDNTRWVFGYYPTPRDLGGPGSSASVQENVDDAMPVLQFGTNVVLTARRYDQRAEDDGFETRISWHIVPAEPAPASIVIARKGTDDYGIAYAEFLASEPYTRPVIMAWDADQQLWAQATVVSSAPPPAAPDCTARTDRTLLGVCIGSNGSNGSVPLAERIIVTEGRFWIDPVNFPLIDHTAYYISNAAAVGSGSQGFWSEIACANSCRRPVFFHHANGWCTMAAQPGGPGQRFRYDSTGGREAQIDAQDNRISYRDIDNAVELETTTGAETDEILAWFLSGTPSTRALVVKRGDLVVNLGVPGATDDTRGSQLCFPYLTAQRVTDAYDPDAIVWAGWFTVQAEATSSTAGTLSFFDGVDPVLEWSGTTAPDGSPVGSTRKRKWKFVVDTEYTGGWSWSWWGSDDIQRVVIRQEDITALPAGFLALARPELYIRAIEVCDSTNPAITKHIGILATDEF